MPIRKYIIFLLLSTALTGCGTPERPTAYNLEFEEVAHGALPARWAFSNGWNYGCNPVIDQAEYRQGKSSLRLIQIDTTKSIGYFYQELPPESVGKTVELSGWIKTQNVWKGYADLWILCDGERDSVMLHDDGRRGVRNTSEWTRVSLRKEIGSNAEPVIFGGVLNGCGTAWFDSFELTIDGQLYSDRPIEASRKELDSRKKDALRHYIHPLRTYEPDNGNEDDLKAFGTLIGDAKIVALGENTHGSSEIFRMKDRLIRYLVTQKGFGVFTIEANMAGSERFNSYLQGDCDPEQFIKELPYGSWGTSEIMEAIDWMRAYNQSSPKITYMGFDMQYYQGSLEVLKEALSDDRRIANTIDAIGRGLDSISTRSDLGFTSMNPRTVAAVAAELDKLSGTIGRSACDEGRKAWLLQNIALLRQFIGEHPGRAWRDRCMADNLRWIEEQYPASKIIAWAHNGHIQKSKNAMGNHLKNRLGDDYLAVGFTFSEGRYSDYRGECQAEAPFPGTLEYALGQLEEPIFVLDLRSLKAENPPLRQWIDDQQYRRIGGLKPFSEFTGTHITDDFDYLIFIRESTPSH